jgi:hypothetical protein
LHQWLWRPQINFPASAFYFSSFGLPHSRT